MESSEATQSPVSVLHTYPKPEQLASSVHNVHRESESEQ